MKNIDTMEPIKVLIIDDSALIRKMLTNCLESEQDMKVIGTAPNGTIGLAKIQQLNPDIVTLDIEMPGMNGLETLRAIRLQSKELPVFMFSTLTEKGAAIALDALEAGATDYVTKPANMGSVNQCISNIQEQLIPKIRDVCRHKHLPVSTPVAPIRLKSSQDQIRKITTPGIRAIAIGVSTGGPNALAKLFSKLRPDLGAPILLVQHMPELFTRLLAERLDAVSQLKVREGQAGVVIQAGEAWIAPGGQHMEVVHAPGGVALRMNKDPHENFCRPAVDVLFRSIASIYGKHSIAAVLTGMGKDGLRGSQMISEAGGYVVAQDQATSVVWGMPGAVAQAGLARQILTIEEIADLINQLSTPESIPKKIDHENQTNKFATPRSI